jgi:hypothetical protein
VKAIVRSVKLDFAEGPLSFRLEVAASLSRDVSVAMQTVGEVTPEEFALIQRVVESEGRLLLGLKLEALDWQQP